MTTLKERIAKEMSAESKLDLIKLNARIALTDELVKQIREKLGANVAGDVDARDVVRLLVEQKDRDVVDRDSLLAGVEDQRLAELDECQIPGLEDGFDQILDDAAQSSTTVFPPALNAPRRVYQTAPRDVEDGGHFDSDYCGRL
jgi:hypothetical protein